MSHSEFIKTLLWVAAFTAAVMSAIIVPSIYIEANNKVKLKESCATIGATLADIGTTGRSYVCIKPEGQIFKVPKLS